MTTLLQLRRQAEEFAARVDAPPGSPVDARTDRLLAVVGELRRQGEAVVADPRPDFAAELRARLMGEAATVLHEQATPALPVPERGHRRERRLVAAATVAVLVGGSAGMAAASQDALPGEALYPVKRVIEQVQAGTATSSASRGRDLLSQASGRLEEVRELLDSGSGAASEQVPGTLREFRRQARAGANELLAAYRDTHDARTIATLRQFAARSLSVLTALSTGAPADAEPALRAAASTLRTIDLEASGMCPDCTSLPPLRLPASLAVQADVERSLARAPGAAAPLGDGHPVIAPKDLLDAVQTEAATSAAPQHPEQRAGGSTTAPPADQPTPSTPQVSVSESIVPQPEPSDVPSSASATPPPTTATSGTTDPGDGSSPGSSESPTSAPDTDGVLETLLPSPTPTINSPLP